MICFKKVDNVPVKKIDEKIVRKKKEDQNENMLKRIDPVFFALRI